MNFKLILGSTLAVCALIVGACESSEPSPVLKPFNADPVVAERTTDFAFSFFQNVTREEPVNKNVFVSPLSLHIALGMLLNGATDETATEIENVLKVHGVDRQQLNSAYLKYLQGLPEVDSKVKLHLANSIWHDKNSLQVNDAYQQLLKSSFLTESFAEDFALTTTSSKINKWASDKTQGKITKVIEDTSGDLVMILMNALYFKGNWQSKFDESKTQSEDFFLQDGTKKKVQMMQGSHPAYVAITPEVTAVQLAYGGGEYVMTLLLPKEGDRVDQLVNQLDVQKWNQLTNASFKNQVNVWLPRFQLDYEINLNKTLQEMGMNKVFSNQAELDGISTSSHLKVSYVKQNTFLQIDEKGSEAAAVTSIGIVPTSGTGTVQPLNIRFDKPFVVMISEKTSGSILFMGKIVSPDSQ